MAIINKTGITNGGTVQAEHVTRAIDALSGVSTDSIVATGSLQGTASFAVTASYAMNGGGSSVTASFAETASLARTASLALTASKLTVSVADTTAATFYPIFADISAGGTTRGYTDINFTYNPQTNTLGPASTAAFIFQGTASLATSASFATSASNATVATGIRVSGSGNNAQSGQMWLSDFTTADWDNLAAVRAINISFGSEVYVIYAIQIS